MPDPICAALTTLGASKYCGKLARREFGDGVRTTSRSPLIRRTINPQGLVAPPQTTQQTELAKLSGVINTEDKTPSDHGRAIELATLASASSFPVWSQVWENRRSQNLDYYAQWDLV